MKIKAKFTVFQEGALSALPGRKRGWRWRLTAANGNIIADGAESYIEQNKATRAVKGLLRTMGINTSGRGWRARMAQDHGILVEIRES